MIHYKHLRKVAGFLSVQSFPPLGDSMDLNQRIIAMQNEINRINSIMYEFRDVHITNHTSMIVTAIKMRINACTAVLEGRGSDSDKIISRNEMDGRGQDNMTAIMDKLENR